MHFIHNFCRTSHISFPSLSFIIVNNMENVLAIIVQTVQWALTSLKMGL